MALLQFLDWRAVCWLRDLQPKWFELEPFLQDIRALWWSKITQLDQVCLNRFCTFSGMQFCEVERWFLPPCCLHGQPSHHSLLELLQEVVLHFQQHRVSNPSWYWRIPLPGQQLEHPQACQHRRILWCYACGGSTSRIQRWQLRWRFQQ